MCSDLQDPPEVIPELLRKYEEGHEQVLVKVNSRAELGFIRRNLTRIFYSIISKSSGGLVPGNVSDFRLMSKKVYSAARNLREQKRFLRGLMSWSGFKSTEIEIDRPPRKYGESKFGARKLFSVIAEATESIYAFSTRPLKIISIFGVFFSLISILSIIFLVFRIFSFGVPFPGFGTLAIINLATFSVLLFALGVVSSYVGLIYEETKHRPLYVIDRTTND
jgi:dolichol-phosphate mannosyltransferase